MAASIPPPRVRAPLRGLLDRWFPARQILIRRQDRMEAVTLSQRRQVLIASVSVMMVLVCGGTGIGGIVRGHDAALAAARARGLQELLTADKVAMSRVMTENASLRARGKAAAGQIAAIRDAAVTAALLKVAALQVRTMPQAESSTDAAVSQAKVETAANSAAVAQLSARTQSAIAQVEGIIKSTGLNPAVMVGAVKTQGAPAIDWAGISADEQMKDNHLLDDIARLQALGAVLARMPLASPVQMVSVTSPFGYRPDPWTGIREFHVGVDLRGPVGTPVDATAPGVVIYAGGETGYGNIVIVDHGYGLTTRYSHLSRIEVRDGQRVGLHQLIGLLGNTGWSTGPHLLYETRFDGQPHNPMQFIKVADVQK